MNVVDHNQARKIIHVDMDCFYAQVEILDRPELKDKPVAIGGPSRTQGVICTSNYVARRFGVKSAMPTFQAVKHCPTLTLIPPNFEKYRAIAKTIHRIYQEFTDKIQPLSLDEAYLDVTDKEDFQGSATMMAKAIQQEVFRKTRLTCSAGISFNKMLAKIASDWRKPNGIFTIPPAMREAFMPPLKLATLPGIGAVTSQKLAQANFIYCRDINKNHLPQLIDLLGKKAAFSLLKRSQGFDDSAVITERDRKSLSIERTFFDPVGIEAIGHYIQSMQPKFHHRLQQLKTEELAKKKISHLFIKMRFVDFSTHTKEIMLNESLSQRLKVERKLNSQLNRLILQHISTIYAHHKKPIRLIGFGIRFKTQQQTQLSFSYYSG